MIDPKPKRLANGQYTFQYLDGTLWSELYGDEYVFKDARIFVEGMAEVKLRNGTITFVNLEKRFLKLPMFAKILDAGDFSEGYAAIKTKNGCTYIDKNGNYIKGAPMFDRAYSFREGYACVQLKNGNWTFINKNGDLMERRFKNAFSGFHEGYVGVKLEDESCTFMDKNGNLMYPRFKSVYSFNGGYARVQLKDGYYTFVDTEGNIMEQKFLGTNDFHEGFAFVQLKDGCYTFVNTNGVLMKVRFNNLKKDFFNSFFYKGMVSIQVDETQKLTMDKYENFWNEEDARKFKEIYDIPEALFDYDKIDKKFFKTALSVIKQKLIDRQKENSVVRVADYGSYLSKKIIEKYGDLVEELKRDKDKEEVMDKIY